MSLKPKGERINEALVIALKHGNTDGAHHKQWVIDQMVRALTGAGYIKFVEDTLIKVHGEWDEGIAP
jgi:hypothetical protein